MKAGEIFKTAVIRVEEEDKYLAVFGDGAITAQQFNTREECENWINNLPEMPWDIIATMACIIARNIKKIEQFKAE